MEGLFVVSIPFLIAIIVIAGFWFEYLGEKALYEIRKLELQIELEEKKAKVIREVKP